MLTKKEISQLLTDCTYIYKRNKVSCYLIRPSDKTVNKLFCGCLYNITSIHQNQLKLTANSRNYMTKLLKLFILQLIHISKFKCFIM